MSEREHDDGRCCENGYFGQTHDCRKGQPARPAEPADYSPSGTNPKIGTGSTANIPEREPAAPQGREWWAVLEEESEDGYSSGAICSDGGGNLHWHDNQFKVIEKSAYDAVVKERDELRQCEFAWEQQRRTVARLEAELQATHTLHMAAEKAANLASIERDRYRAALERIIAKSHSWLITEETGPIVGPVHDSYREIATEALKEKS